MTALDKTRRPLERRSQSCEADTESDVATEGARGVPQGGDRRQGAGQTGQVPWMELWARPCSPALSMKP